MSERSGAVEVVGWAGPNGEPFDRVRPAAPAEAGAWRPGGAGLVALRAIHDAGQGIVAVQARSRAYARVLLEDVAYVDGKPVLPIRVGEVKEAVAFGWARSGCRVRFPVGVLERPAGRGRPVPVVGLLRGLGRPTAGPAVDCGAPTSSGDPVFLEPARASIGGPDPGPVGAPVDDLGQLPVRHPKIHPAESPLGG
jgi:hypothetical protein